MIENFNEFIQSVKLGAMAAIAPTMSKGVFSNIVEKAVIVAVGAGLAVWVNDKRQDDKLETMVKSIKSVDDKLEKLDREGSRPEIQLRQQILDHERRIGALEDHRLSLRAR